MGKVTLEIKVEEECLTCPRREMETIGIGVVKIDRCKHLAFCQDIRQNWERVKANAKEQEAAGHEQTSGEKGL